MRIDDKISDVLRNKNHNHVLSIAPDKTVYEALEMMAEYNIGALPVCFEGHLLGMLSERDYARKCALLGHTSKETRVVDIMTAPVRSVSPAHTVDECLMLMTHLTRSPMEMRPMRRSRSSTGRWVISSQQEAIG